MFSGIKELIANINEIVIIATGLITCVSSYFAGVHRERKKGKKK